MGLDHGMAGLGSSLCSIILLVTSKVGEADKPEMDWVNACAKDSPTGKGIQEEGKINSLSVAGHSVGN
jgi:hypothetical protein